ncbi:MAG: excalibur calcium-binding domain-containing protein [Burkholderiales bacterium]
MDEPTPPPRPEPARRRPGGPSALSNTVAVLLVLALGLYAYERYAHEPDRSGAGHAALAPAAASLAAPADRPIDLGRACDGRTQCAQMSSCTEARYFLQNCPGVEMDSDRNGIPCEKTWCNSPLAR